MNQEYLKHLNQFYLNQFQQGRAVQNDITLDAIHSGEDQFDIAKSCDSWSISWLYAPRNSAGSHSDDSMETLESSVKNKSEILSRSLDSLSISPTARLMLSEAKNNGWKLALEDLGGADFHIDGFEKTIIIASHGMSESAIGRSSYFSNMILVALIRALRDIWQEKRYGAFEDDYGPEAILTLERIRAADLDIIAILVAWELRSEDKGDLWRYMIGSDIGDLAMRFSGHLEREPASHFTHDALLATFKQWFQSEERIDTCDHETLNYLDNVLSNAGRNKPFGKRRLSAIAIERISCLPDKTAYLQGRGREILSNPLYAGMNDEINQSHLMHILYDLSVTYAGGVPFRNASLASKIFPDSVIPTDGGEMH